MKNSISHILLVMLLLLTSAVASAQEKSINDSINPYRVTVRSSLHGITLLNNLDTYLSGYNYKGAGYSYNCEKIRNAHTGCYNWKYQTLLSAHVGYTELNGNSSQLSFMARRHWSGYHPFRIGNNLQLMAGVQLQAEGGALYIPANGNNLVSVKLRTALAATGMALYHFDIAHRRCMARYQVDIPLAGVMFSPEFGQSYYEIFGLGHTHGIVKFAHPFNSPSWRHTLSLDLPMGNNTLRVAYIADLYQSEVNKLRTHIYSHTFAIGFVKTIYKVKRNDPIKAYSPLL